MLNCRGKYSVALLTVLCNWSFGGWTLGQERTKYHRVFSTQAAVNRINQMSWLPASEKLAVVSGSITSGQCCFVHIPTRGLVYSRPNRSAELTAVSLAHSNLVAAADTEGSVYLIADDGQLKESWRVQNECITAMAYSKAGNLYALGGGNGSIRLWDATEKKIRVFHSEHHSYIRAITFSNDGKTVISGDSAGKLCRWDLSSGRLTMRRVHEGPITVISFSPDGGKLITGGFDGLIRMWEADLTREIHRFKFRFGEVRGLYYCPKTNWIACGGGGPRLVGDPEGGVQVFHSVSGKEVSSFPIQGTWVTALLGSPASCKTLAVGCHSGEFSIWCLGEEKSVGGP